MYNKIVKYEFNNELVEFEIGESNVMVNATQMAKLLGKDIQEFTRNENTKRFIEECLKTENSRFISVKTKDDLIISKQKSGTFMHRILALKFAAWLNPAFELWVYSTIDDILFGYYKQIEQELKTSAKRVNKINELKTELELLDIFNEYEDLKKEENKAVRQRNNQNRGQLDLFRKTI